MSMAHLRDYYNVPAKRGMRVDIYYNDGRSVDGRRIAVSGRITSSNGAHIWIKSGGGGVTGPWHPTDGVVYLSGDSSVLLDTRKDSGRDTP